MKTVVISLCLFTFLFLITSPFISAKEAENDLLDRWTNTQRSLIKSLSIDSYDTFRPSPSNRFSDNLSAAILGEKIFNDTRFSANGKISCAKCHRPDYSNTDKLPVARGIARTSRRTMPLIGVTFQRWFFWDGRKDSLWAQSLGPLENPLEHGLTRSRIAQLIIRYYRSEYEGAIGPLPDLAPEVLSDVVDSDRKYLADSSIQNSISMKNREKITQVFVNTGKALASYVRTLVLSPTPFDLYARALAQADKSDLSILSARQKKGLRLFIGQAKCINCHNGPMFSNGEFHHVGIPDKGETDRGRAAVINTISENEFGCLSRWSDANPETECAHVKFLNLDPERYERAFKTPTLRNVAIRPPYMHAGQYNTLSDVMSHYQAMSQRVEVDEIFHNDLRDDDLINLNLFLQSLTSLDDRTR